MSSPSLTGATNAAVGNFAMQNNTTGENNIAMGQNALGANTFGYGNSALGSYSLNSNTEGYENAAVGIDALSDNTSGIQNVGVGSNAGSGVLTGNYNSFVGAYSGANSGSSNNVMVGYSSGQGGYGSGSNNVFIGSLAGANPNTPAGSNNVFIGYQSGGNESGSNLLYIANSNTSSPLIYGNFSNKHVTIHDSLTAKYFQMSNGATAGYVLQTDAAGNATWVAPSALSGQWTTSGNNIYNSNSGNVGVGTSSPNYAFHLKSATQEPLFIEGSSTTGTWLDLNNTTTGGHNWNTISTGSANGEGAGKLLIRDGTKSTVRLTIDTLGYLGVATTSPNSTLDVNGSLTLATTVISAGSNTLVLGATNYCVIYNGGSGNTVTFPAASTCTGRVYIIINHGTGAVTTATYYTANGSTSTSLSAGSSLQIISDGTQWQKMN